VAFKLKKTTVDSVVQQDNIDERNDSATKLEDSSSMEKLSGQVPESTLESDGTKQGKSSDEITKEKELNTAEATESEKCIGDAPVESEKHGDSESLSRDGKSISGNVNAKNQISREDLKEAFKKFGTVRVMIIHATFWILLLLV
jgi:lupus La protein